MKKGQVVTGVIEKTIFPNKGILYTEEGKQVIVKNTLTGFAPRVYETSSLDLFMHIYVS